jgi:hypothetical protein
MDLAAGEPEPAFVNLLRSPGIDSPAWRDQFLGIDSRSPWTFINTSSVLANQTPWTSLHWSVPSSLPPPPPPPLKSGCTVQLCWPPCQLRGEGAADQFNSSLSQEMRACCDTWESEANVKGVRRWLLVRSLDNKKSEIYSFLPWIN